MAYTGFHGQASLVACSVIVSLIVPYRAYTLRLGHNGQPAHSSSRREDVDLEGFCRALAQASQGPAYYDMYPCCTLNDWSHASCRRLCTSFSILNNSSLGLYPRIVRHRQTQTERLGRGKWPALLCALLVFLSRYPFSTLRR